MIRKRKFIAFSVILTVVVSVVCAHFLKSAKPKTLTVMDADGVTYVAILDENNNVYAGVTDSRGNLYAAPIGSNGVVDKEHTLYAVPNYIGTFPFNDTTRGDNININQTNGIDFSGGAVVKPSNENTDQSSTTGNAVTEEEKYLSDQFIALFNSGVYAMTFTADDPELTEDITMAVRNGSLYMDTSMEGISAKVIYDSNKKSGFIIIPQLKVYCTLPDDMVKEMSNTDFSMPDTSDAVKKEKYDVVIDGKDCVCEEFEYEDGRQRYFYFYNDQLIRMVIIENGSSVVYNIKSISSEVDKSYFEIPKGYFKIDLDKIMK